MQQWVPKVQSFRTEALQALAAIVTLGLTSCSSNEAPKEWQDVAEFQDVKANDTNLIQPEIQVQPNDVSETGTPSKECFDSDDSNYFKAGFVSVDPGKPTQKTYIDICKDTAFLYEQTCDGNQYKKVIVKCADVLPGGMCVENDGGGKCDLGAKYTVDAGSTDTSNNAPDTTSVIDVGPDIPPVDYLKQNPLPFALDLTGQKGWSGLPSSNVQCVKGESYEKAPLLSQCIYLKALYDVDGNPIVATSYSDLVLKIKNGGQYFTALITGDNVYPKLSTGKTVAFVHGGLNWSTFVPKATENMPILADKWPSLELGIQFYEKMTKSSTNYNGCYASYWAPNGFATCVK